jgi:hypothetical protein
MRNWFLNSSRKETNSKRETRIQRIMRKRRKTKTKIRRRWNVLSTIPFISASFFTTRITIAARIKAHSNPTGLFCIPIPQNVETISKHLITVKQCQAGHMPCYYKYISDPVAQVSEKPCPKKTRTRKRTGGDK